MKASVLLILLCYAFLGCNTPQRAIDNSTDGTTLGQEDTVRIANDNLEYEIIIIDPGFHSWLLSTARPEGYYSQQFLESRNRIFVTEWNSRTLQPHRYDPKLYEMSIDYDPTVDYGYEVNYKLYNYFIYFQLTYKQRLSGFYPRI